MACNFCETIMGREWQISGFEGTFVALVFAEFLSGMLSLSEY